MRSRLRSLYGGTMVRSFQQGEMAYLAFLVKAGRALLFPMYKGMTSEGRRSRRAAPTKFATW